MVPQQKSGGGKQVYYAALCAERRVLRDTGRLQNDFRALEPITSAAWRAIIDTSGSSGIPFWTPQIRFFTASSARWRRPGRGSPPRSTPRAA
uniref:Uncharacterized protein n=1 Tax=mine drainage metagenome TaxID=410659 RepID=E6PCA5_9ZZZZ